MARVSSASPSTLDFLVYKVIISSTVGDQPPLVQGADKVFFFFFRKAESGSEDWAGGGFGG